MTEIIQLKDFDRSVADLYRHGGQKKKRADKVCSLLGRMTLGNRPFEGVPVTNHGESRIKHCVKYDLGDGYRLITIQTNKFIALCFTGDHEDCDRWLNRNSGLTVAREKGILVPLYKSVSSDGPLTRDPVPSSKTLLDRLDSGRQNELLADLPPAVIGRVYELGKIVTGDEVAAVCASISNETRRAIVHDVLVMLSNGDIQGAIRRLDLEKQVVQPLEEVPENEIVQVRDGDEIRRVRVGSEEHKKWLERFAREAEFIEWLLFMHPEQEAVVIEDFAGPAQLSGVSGSGKTCVAVRRALRLAKAENSAKVLIVTLNRSLAGLIESLVKDAAEDTHLTDRIEVLSFFELCQSLLAKFEPENSHIYNDVTWKLQEHIDEVFREYYRGWHNFRASDAILPVHMSLFSQDVNAETYLREEFDWIRSAVSSTQRGDYLNLERTGRKYPVPERWRERILNGLAGWETKMRAVGVIDYLGLTTSLSTHLSRIEPQYSHIVVDEAQDFGTTELSIIRRLVPEKGNDIFLCGDVAQHVLPKHRSMAQAGISVSGRSRRIIRNYRNSREILKAAYSVLIENLSEDLIDDSDLEILDPEYANRSSPRPCVLVAGDLSEEIGYARGLIRDHLERRPTDRCCIAFAGYSMRELRDLAATLNLPTLDGAKVPLESPLVLSDLEQTKGYEFNVVAVLNCCEGVLPPSSIPEAEAFRHACRLYVTMTRARDELHLSYNGKVSPWLQAASSELAFMTWSDVAELDETLVRPEPRHLPEYEEGRAEDVFGLDGRQFIYSPQAIGLSLEALQKIDELVDGRGMARAGRRVKWRDIGSLRADLESEPFARSLFGPKLQGELRQRFSEL